MDFEFNKNWRERIFRYAPLILWVGVVLFASTGSGSMAETSRFIGPLLHWLFPHTPEATIISIHAFVRKCAHFTEYGILGFWAARAFTDSAQIFLRKYWFAFAFLTVGLIASIDEYNQSFNPARTSSVYDVLLDCFGGLTIISIYAVYRSRKLPKV